MFTQPLYEVRCHGKDEWTEISDIEIMSGLYKIYRKVTPVIKEMLKGKEVQTPDGLYRLRFEPKV